MDTSIRVSSSIGNRNRGRCRPPGNQRRGERTEASTRSPKGQGRAVRNTQVRYKTKFHAMLAEVARPKATVLIAAASVTMPGAMATRPRRVSDCIAPQPWRGPDTREELGQGELDTPGGGDGRDQKPGERAGTVGMTGGEHPAPIEEKAHGHGHAPGDQLGNPDPPEGNREDPRQRHEHHVVGDSIDHAARRETADLRGPEAGQRLEPRKGGEADTECHEALIPWRRRGCQVRRFRTSDTGTWPCWATFARGRN